MEIDRSESRKCGAASYLEVEDLARSVDYYTDVLGFQVDMMDNGFALVSRNCVSIMFQRSELLRDPEDGAWAGYVLVDDIERSHREFAEKGVKITNPVADRLWGAREFEVQDLNGHHLRFAQLVS